MLGRDLLRWRQRGPIVTPQWLKPTPARLSLAEDILAVFAENIASRRRQFDEAVQVVVQRAGSVPVAKGLVKLVDDASTWTEPGACSGRRLAVLGLAAQHIGRYGSLADFRRAVAQADDQGATPEQLSEDLYADLPSRACLQQVPDWSARRLLQAYNTALVQGLVLSADEVVITLQDTAQARCSNRAAAVARRRFSSALGRGPS